MTSKYIFILASMIAFSAGAQGKNGFFPTRFPWDVPTTSFVLGASAPEPAATSNLLYYGGPVISNVKAYAVFWGPGVNADIQSKIGGYYTAISNSTYVDWLNEYKTNVKAIDGRDGTNQTIGRGSYAGSITITPFNTKTTVDDVEIQAELQAQIDAGKLPKPDANTLYMIYFPPGLIITASGMQSCAQFCAYHGFKGSPETPHFYFGVMPDLGGMCALGCGFAPTPFDSVTAISAHEFIEAITDPFPTPGNNPAYPQAWNTTDGSEIGDVCVNSGSNILTAGTAKYLVQNEWDNSVSACTTKAWTSP